MWCREGATIARRRDRGRPAPQWERICAAVCWGQPLVLTLTAILAFFMPSAPLIAAWLALTLVSIAGTGFGRAGPLALSVMLPVKILLYFGRALVG